MKPTHPEKYGQAWPCFLLCYYSGILPRRRPAGRIQNLFEQIRKQGLINQSIIYDENETTIA
jgi:hypothetical protein